MTGAHPKKIDDTQDDAGEKLNAVSDAPSRKKAPGAFLTISEVAEQLDVQQHVLRFWETKFSQVRPLKRGGGRRYYRPEDVALLSKIHILLYTEGYTIKGVQKLLKTQGRAALVGDHASSPTPASVVKTPAPANEQAVQRIPAPPAQQSTIAAAAAATSAAYGSASSPIMPPRTAAALSEKQRSILQAMLGDLRDLRDMISTEGKESQG